MRQFFAVSTLDEVRKAEKRMEVARKALFAYMDLPEQQHIDGHRRARLAKNLQAATDEYVNLIEALSPVSD
jgi:hypothetical protein